eukprot:1249268-Pleurochrysis_carterae.AAC.3
MSKLLLSGRYPFVEHGHGSWHASSSALPSQATRKVLNKPTSRVCLQNRNSNLRHRKQRCTRQDIVRCLCRRVIRYRRGVVQTQINVPRQCIGIAADICSETATSLLDAALSHDGHVRTSEALRT